MQSYYWTTLVWLRMKNMNHKNISKIIFLLCLLHPCRFVPTRTQETLTTTHQTLTQYRQTICPVGTKTFNDHAMCLILVVSCTGINEQKSNQLLKLSIQQLCHGGTVFCFTDSDFCFFSLALQESLFFVSDSYQSSF